MTRWEFRIVSCLAGGNTSATFHKKLVMSFDQRHGHEFCWSLVLPMCKDLRLRVCFAFLLCNINLSLFMAIYCLLVQTKFLKIRLHFHPHLNNPHVGNPFTSSLSRSGNEVGGKGVRLGRTPLHLFSDCENVFMRNTMVLNIYNTRHYNV